MYKFYTTKTEDFRPLDFQSGKRLALTAGEMKQCDCCGKKISKGVWTNLGQLLGTECAGSVDMLNWHPQTRTDEKYRRFLNVSSKVLDFYTRYTA